MKLLSGFYLMVCLVMTLFLSFSLTLFLDLPFCTSAWLFGFVILTLRLFCGLQPVLPLLVMVAILILLCFLELTHARYLTTVLIPDSPSKASFLFSNRERLLSVQTLQWAFTVISEDRDEREIDRERTRGRGKWNKINLKTNTWFSIGFNMYFQLKIKI